MVQSLPATMSNIGSRNPSQAGKKIILFLPRIRMTLFIKKTTTVFYEILVGQPVMLFGVYSPVCPFLFTVQTPSFCWGNRTIGFGDAFMLLDSLLLSDEISGFRRSQLSGSVSLPDPVDLVMLSLSYLRSGSLGRSKIYHSEDQCKG